MSQQYDPSHMSAEEVCALLDELGLSARAAAERYGLGGAHSIYTWRQRGISGGWAALLRRERDGLRCPPHIDEARAHA